VAGHGDYHIAPETAGEIMTVLYQRLESGFDTGSKPVARLFGWQESLIRRAKKFYAWGYTKMMDISRIRRDGGTQARSEIPKETHDRYTELMKNGVRFPPVVVFYDGTNYWLGDGFIRIDVAESLGLTQIDADVRQGTVKDAILFSFNVNTRHGCPPSVDDRRRAAIRMLEDPEWRLWSDRQIARHCGIGCHKTVAAYRRESIWGNSPDDQNNTRIYSRNGRIVSYLAPERTAAATESIDTVTETEDETAEDRHSEIPDSEPTTDETDETQSQPEPQIDESEINYRGWLESIGQPEPAIVLDMTPKDFPESVAVATPITKAPTIKKSERTDGMLRGSRVYGELSDACVEKFKQEAVFYRTVHKAFQKFQERVQIARNQYHANEPDSGEKLAGPFVARAIAMATTADFRDWEPCMNCRNDSLMSCGRVKGRVCSNCRGFGFTLNPLPERVEIA